MSYEEIENKLKELYRKKQQLEYDLKYAMARQGYPETEYKNGYSIMKQLEDVEKQIYDLNLQLRNIPKIIKCVKVKGNIVGRYEYKFPEFNIKLYEGNKWGCPTDLETGFKTEVITDKDNIPIMVRRYLRNSDTKGYLLCYEYPIELDVKPNPEEIKPIPKQESIDRRPFSKQDLIPQKGYMDKLQELVQCPQCKVILPRTYFTRGYSLFGKTPCPNCAYLEDWNKLPSIQDQNTKEEQEQNKKGILSKIKKK